MTTWTDIQTGWRTRWSSLRAHLRDAWNWGADTSTEAQRKRAERAARKAQLRRDPIVQILRWSAIIIGGIFVALVIALATLDWNLLRGPAARLASARLGRAVNIDGNLHVHIWTLTPHVEVEGLRIANTDWAGGGDMAKIGKLIFDIRLLPLLHGHAVVPLIDVENADIHLVRDRDGQNNWTFGDANDRMPTHLPPIRHFVIRDARLDVEDRRRKLVFTGTVNSNESAQGGQRGFWMTGDGTLNREPFRADIHGAPLLHVDASKPYPFTLDLHSGTTHIVADGSITSPFDFGRLQARTTMSGNSLADLYYLTGLVMPSTPPYNLTSNFSRNGATYRLDNLGGHLGHSDLEGYLAVDASSGRLFLTGDLHSRHVLFDDLGFLFGGGKGRVTSPKAPPASKTPQPDSGTITVAGKETATPARLFLPDTPLEVDRVRQMDARIHYVADRIDSQDIPLRRLSLKLSLDHGVMVIDPLSLSLVKGRIDGSVKLDATKDVPFTTLDLRLRDLSLEQFVSGKPPALQGTLEARAKLAGPGNSVHKLASNANGTVTVVVPHGQMREAFAELMGINLLNGGWELLTHDKSPTDLRCMVASFNAHDGVLTAQRMTVDTDVVAANGTGRVNLRDETMDLKVTGQPKKFRIGRIKAPIEVTGSLQAPHVGVDAGKALPQAGLGVILGAVVAPLAAILPFVDGGLAKDANCTALVSEAKSRGAPVKRKPSP
ncbi:MAG TPA: AsmA family protein [Rhizomicrobium sp.]|jgi:hypothetical protein